MIYVILGVTSVISSISYLITHINGDRISEGASYISAAYAVWSVLIVFPEGKYVVGTLMLLPTITLLSLFFFNLIQSVKKNMNK